MCSGRFPVACGWDLPAFFLFFCLLWGGGVCLVLPLPSLCCRMHWLVNGVTNWTTDRALVCRCVVSGYGLCPSAVRPVIHAHALAGGLSCGAGVRLRFFRLCYCAMGFSCKRGGQREGWGAAGVPFWGSGCLVFLPRQCRLLAFGVFKFPSARG